MDWTIFVIANPILFAVKVKTCRRNNIFSSFLCNYFAVLKYGFSSAVQALSIKYVFPLAVRFFKDWSEVFLYLCSVANSVLIIPSIEFCKRQSIIENPKEINEKYRTFLTVLEFAVPFTEFRQRNNANRIDGASRCFGESSRVILNKSPIYIICPIFFHLYRAEYGIGDRSAEEHLKNKKTSRGS